ncbi:heat-inducible transcriptional repressor HrcA [Stigmatella aurantiaca]|uniref:Heat-inducible transcription repressor HrcA n=1 Tax=Stigmatella aurantiaca (strain DW4/3-1) TaxID=378806 RepID=Q08V84_STIAD|nr:heat-inducible transcriptional repressor HrcA [Stigmatella aurantiaca]ADO68978.1 Heat-inducible transcription repressor HrcA [Stigmatella aurantiaca DW4/3-1]EAU64396.1 heat-inducible transcription repressor HrcA [Stigmatella aurantiaca DW4/3-1]
MSEEIGDREKEVLRAVVQEYITTGGPVGSHQLSRKSGFDVSSATLRNVLADLEELGFLEKPHTSAGRVPTDQGYRFYVDTLVRLKEPAPRDREFIHAGLGQEKNVGEMLSEASRVLHSLTRHASVVITPRPDASVFHRIEFVRLREDRVLAVLVGNGGQVQNKVITVDFPITSDELLKASNFLSELLREVPLEEARERIRQEMDQEQALYNVLTSKALKLGAAATDLQTPESERVRIEGTNSFLEQPEFADVERMRALFKMLDEKHKLLQLLDRVQRAREMQIFIGAESEFSAAGELTVIASPYGSREQVLGSVGVIGPTRMNYQRVIPLVNFTAQVLSRVLGQD